MQRSQIEFIINVFKKPVMSDINFGELGLIGALLSLAAVLLGRFLTSYFDAKGKNFADKRDIQVITGKVEEIKNQYATTLALLNANLSLASKGIESFDAKAFESYVSFHQATSHVLRDLAFVDFSLLDHENIAYMKQYNKRTIDGYTRLNLTKSDLELFNDHSQISQKAYELHTACIGHLGKVNLLVTTIKHLVEAIEKYKQEKVNYFIQKIDNVGLLEFYNKTLDEKEADFTKTFGDLKNCISGETFKKAMEIQGQYEVLVRQYVKEERMNLLKQ